MVHRVTKSWTRLRNFHNNYLARLYKDSPWYTAHESESHSSHVQLFANPWTVQSMEFSRQEYWRGSLSLLQGISPTQGSNPGLPHCRQILYQLSHQGSPRILEWVAYPFSSRSSGPRNWTRVSCIAGGFFTKHIGAQKVGGIIKSKRI